MKTPKHSSEGRYAFSWPHWIAPSSFLISTGTLFYFLWVSGIVPLQYIFAYIGVTLLLLALVSWLSFRIFRKMCIFARIMAYVIVVLFMLAATAGVYALNQGTSLLDSVGSDEPDAVEIKKDTSFNVFISGIDTYGDIAMQSRSDVNIVATVNPTKHTVLLTTIPRDSYVSVALGGQDGMDKLTHAGNYGVESSMATVARLLDTDIDAYVRINFSSFLEIIDALGGVTVSNPTAFDSYGEHFDAGEITLNSERALVYSRERKSLEGGDVDRGKNQQRVIEGIINELTSVQSLGAYNALLESVSSSIDTNISSASLKSLINSQVSSPSSWSTSSYVLTGKGQTGGLPSFAMPGYELYMYVLDEDSVQKAHDDIIKSLEAS